MWLVEILRRTQYTNHGVLFYAEHLPGRKRNTNHGVLFFGEHLPRRKHQPGVFFGIPAGLKNYLLSLGNAKYSNLKFFWFITFFPAININQAISL